MSSGLAIALIISEAILTVSSTLAQLAALNAKVQAGETVTPEEIANAFAAKDASVSRFHAAGQNDKPDGETPA